MSSPIAPLPQYRDGEAYGGLPPFLYRAVMDATSQAVSACMKSHASGLPIEAWCIDYADVLRKAVAEATRITKSECAVCGSEIGDAHKVLDRFGAPCEDGDTVADRITMLRDSYEHRLAAAGAP